MGAESSSLQCVTSLNDSLDKIEKRLFTIEDLILHHQQTAAINDSIFISGVKIKVNNNVNLLCGPIIASVTATDLSVLLEVDADAFIQFVIFQKNESLLTKDRYFNQCEFPLKKETPKMCKITDLEPGNEYIIYLGGFSEKSIYCNYLQIKTLPSTVINPKNTQEHLEFIVYNPDFLLNKEMEKRFVEQFIVSSANESKPINIDKSSSSHTGKAGKTTCIIQKFSFQSLISFFQHQIIELLQYLHDSNFEKEKLSEKLIYLEKVLREFFRNYFNGNSKQVQSTFKEENLKGANIQHILNRFTMQIFLVSSYDDDLSKLLLDILVAMTGSYVPPSSSASGTAGSTTLLPVGGAGSPSFASPMTASPSKANLVTSPPLSPNPKNQTTNSNNNSTANLKKVSSAASFSTAGTAIGTNNQTVAGKQGSLFGMEENNNSFLTNLYSSVVDERRTNTERSYMELINQLKDLDYLFLSMIARMIRRVTWIYLRQLWDPNYEEMIEMDRQREAQLRQIFWLRRESVCKMIFKAKLNKFSHSANTIVSFVSLICCSLSLIIDSFYF
jgi:hypothetical protein